MIILKLISRLPFFVLYRISDFLYFLLRYVVGYRKKVIMKNLRNAFPEKSGQELIQIKNKFYRHLGDVVVESLKTLTISEAELNRRVKLINPEVITTFYDRGQSVIGLSSHQGNWEWMLVSCSSQLPFHIDAVYMQLKNAFFDQLMQQIRGRFGATPIEKQTSFRSMVQQKKISITAMVADQRAQKSQYQYYTTFLNQDTGFYEGPERIAQKLKRPAFIVNMKRVKRGYYTIDFHVIDEPPFNPSPNYITDQFAKLIEKAIRERPAEWLWSHNRWKYKRQTPEMSASVKS
ncbi:lysophospholipid acyltransferase family protein [Catalinimonas niigatensis]|uniref:lysophospholipid acyltransferase family protein n=1 Tax=Catalinimonas niigatensis TaxID=1397264 RepID=UPI0026655421|nr:lysophospholipid acyltransferase family protein [Catalinimonas niigatensis]WPP52249.1 lysophospholipid acyltransferase family protein [Catalinimonas niigatensis]